MIIIEVDYKGNIYLRSTVGEKYYDILFDSADSKSGISLQEISKVVVKANKELRKEYHYIEQYLARGEIIMSDITLKGRASRSIKKMDAEEYDEYLSNGDFLACDTSCAEDSFYRIQPIRETETDYDDTKYADCVDYDTYTDYDSEFMFSGVESTESIEKKSEQKGKCIHNRIIMSDMLNTNPAYYDTTLIKGDKDSKIVISNVRRVDGFCAQRLVFYTDGHVKVQYGSSSLCRTLKLIEDQDGNIIIDE